VQPGHRALVVDDDDDIRDLLVHVLEKSGIDVRSAGTGAEAIEVARAFDPDLVTLDLSLPDLDGTEVCREIRSFSSAYIVMITARSDEIDRLVGLEVGADDYLSKPFSPREVRARAQALLRRPRLEPTAAPATGSPVQEPARVPEAVAGSALVIDPARHAAQLDGVAVPLTPAEVDLLAAMATRPGHAWSRGELVREVWQGEFIESDFLVDVHVGNVRRKLKRAGGHGEWITTVAGSGYRFDPS
jgi:DNA-binding response OmpR family regulator